MANIGGSSNEAFTSGVQHQVNPGRSNVGGITMPGGIRTADSGVVPADWSGTTPHSVLSTTPGSAESSSGVTFEGAQRLSGNFSTPGAMGKFADAMSGGADDNLTTGEE